MTPELASKWADALESGKYKQCTGLLRQGDQFCCLGVLSEIICCPNYPDTVNYPVDVLTQEDIDHFIELNDIDKKSFKQLAEIVRQRYIK